MVATEVRIFHGCSLEEGILNIKKSTGWTSHDVVAKLRNLLKIRKIGHAGTLDPAATGVLPVLVGKATRIAEYLVEWNKEYRAVLRLGETTDTQDATGVVMTRASVEGVRPADILAVVSRFQGQVAQIPPMFSAVKVGGVPLYKTARAGRTVERESREVTVHRIEVLGIEGPDVTLRVVCSKGTYIRTLCSDIGEVLGVGGHMFTLVRNRVGPLNIEDALTLEQIQSKLHTGELADCLVSLDQALEALPMVELDEATSARVLHGVPVPFHAISWGAGPPPSGFAGQTVRLKDPSGCLLALATVPREKPWPRVGSQTGECVLSIVKVLADQRRPVDGGRVVESSD